MMGVYEEFFEKKVRHKFYCWKYIRGFIYIFTTPIFIYLKPYELLNVELRQTEEKINLVRKGKDLQDILDKKKLHLEVLLQTLTVSNLGPNQSDVYFAIRLHDKVKRDYVDVHIKSRKRFNEIMIGERIISLKTYNPHTGERNYQTLIQEIFTLMTMSLDEVRQYLEAPQNQNQNQA
mmetsp:Transcript_9717/g.8558  ORF Transcript_9717/g.8558 Transcript_9717/m.8558 type:complete len:177 (-) Transcript_9717:31-561(-)